jgi:hypothetical protein
MFLGVCERASHVRDVYVNLAKWNLLGVRSVVLAHMYPLALHGSSFVLGIFDPSPGEILEVVIRSAAGIQVGSFRLDVTPMEGSGPPGEDPGEKSFDLSGGWVLAIAPADLGGFFIPGPGLYAVLVRIAGEEVAVGGVHFGVVDPAPLTPERIAAIKSDPEASKLIRCELRCSGCGDGMTPYAALDRSPKLEGSGYVWYQDLPDAFRCSCGAFEVDLRTAKRNMHGLLGQTGLAQDKALSLPLYERGVIDSLRIELGALVASDPVEEILQRFFVANPLTLHMFYPQKIFPKAPILTKFKTDFAVCTANRELILIELETASRRLMKADGGLSSEVQHAFDQVHDWLRVCDEQRSAALECIGISANEVASVRGVIVAGRDAGYDGEKLRNLKARDFGRISLCTYDDVVTSLGGLAHHLLNSNARDKSNP